MIRQVKRPRDAMSSRVSSSGLDKDSAMNSRSSSCDNKIADIVAIKMPAKLNLIR